jgi:hypothetical protein
MRTDERGTAYCSVDGRGPLLLSLGEGLWPWPANAIVQHGYLPIGNDFRLV